MDQRRKSNALRRLVTLAVAISFGLASGTQILEGGAQPRTSQVLLLAVGVIAMRVIFFLSTLQIQREIAFVVYYTCIGALILFGLRKCGFA